MSKLTATTAMLMTPEEKALFRASESRLLPKVEDALLRTQIERARRLRKKYGDLLERERAKAQAEGAEPGSRAANGNANTVRKATAFTYVVANFEAESDRRAGVIVPSADATKKKAAATKTSDASKKQSAARATKSKSSEARKPTSGARGSKPHSGESGESLAANGAVPRPGARSAAVRAKQSDLRQQRGPSQRQVGHAAARGRRQQARSDSRG